MRAAVTNDKPGFDIIDLPDPNPGPGELVIRVAACGVCGSDIKAQPYMPPGMIMGHEMGGAVVAAGPGAGAWLEGTNIAVLPIISCGNCQYCDAGVVTHCARSGYLGMGPAGGFAEFAVVPARHAFAVPAETPELHSALVEPFAVGLHGVNRAELRAGDDVLVVGAGGVGLTTVAWARAKGAQRVTVADPNRERGQSVLAMGATDVIAEVADAEVDAYDVVIECVGRPELIQACQPAVRPRGRIVVAGACAEPTAIEPVTALLKELELRYSVCYTPDEFREVIAAFADGSIDPTPMMGPTLGLSRISEAFDLVRAAVVQGRVLVNPATSPSLRP
jgi:(R,R)-butanediol dehydrogenase / meso-butanediol dehydrogenase / diacetyl reductase